MNIKNKILVTVVTRDNPVMLDHLFRSIEQYDSGYEYDIFIVDNDSQTKEQLNILNKLSKKYQIYNADNDRVEASFDIGYKKNLDYRYYFFIHDDSAVVKNNWLKVFIDRLHSNYVEQIIQTTHLKHLPIGKVGAQTQFWRNYNSVMGYSIQCPFLEEILKTLDFEIPTIFKYGDCDRILITNECLKATNGILSVKDFKEIQQNNKKLYEELCYILNKHLKYLDEGIPPKNKYPANECWNKFCLTAEMMNSIVPLIHGYRTVGLEGDGFLESIHGYDVPWGNSHIVHYGSPNFREFIAKKFKTDKEEVKKHFNNKSFIVKMDKLIKQYNGDK